MANFALNYSFSRNLNIPLDEDAVKVSLAEVMTYVQTKSKCYAGQLFSVTGDTENNGLYIALTTGAEGQVIKLASQDALDAVAASAGKIDTIKLNGSALTINDKVVNIDLSTYATIDYVDGKISGLTEVYAPKAEFEEVQKKVDEITSTGGEPNVQSDWDTTDETADSFIKNKPDLTVYAETTAVTDAIAEVFESGVSYTDAKVKEVSDVVSVLVGEDAQKSARAIAAEEVAKVVASADTDFDTLKEIADWIKNDTTGAANMANDIAALKEADIALDERLDVVEGAKHTHSNKDVLDDISSEKVAAWDAAEQNAKAYADGLAGNYDAAGSAESALTEAKAYADGQVAEAILSANTAASNAQAAAKTYTDGQVAEAILSANTAASNAQAAAKTYTDGQVAEAILSANTAAADALTEAKSYADTEIGKLGNTYATTASVDTIKTTLENKINTDIAGLSEVYDVKGAAAGALGEAKTYADGLAKNYDKFGDAAQALIDAKSYADGLAGNYDAAGAAATALKDAKDYADDLAGNYDAAGAAVSAAASALTDAKNFTLDEIAKLSEKYDVKGAADSALTAANKYTDDKLVDYATKSYVTDTIVGQLSGGTVVIEGYAKVEDVKAQVASAKTEAIAAAEAYADGLAKNYDKFGDAAQALIDAKSYADGLAGNYDAAGAAATALKDAKDYADGLNEAMDTRVKVLEGIDHDKLVADAIAEVVASADTSFDTLKEIADWILNDTTGAASMANDIADLKAINADTRLDALEAISGQSHVHGNKDVLDGISSEKVAAWDAAKQNAKDYADGQVAEAILSANTAAADAQAAAEATAAADATSKANIAEQNAKSYADGLAGNYDAAGSAESALTEAKSYADGLVENIKPYEGGVAANIAMGENDTYVVDVKVSDAEQNFLHVNADNELEVSAITLDAAVTSKDIVIEGGQWESMVKTVYTGGTVPAGTTWESFLEAMLCVEKFPGTISTTSAFTVSCGNINPGLSTTGTVEVGTLITLNKVTANDTTASQSITVGTFSGAGKTYGYKIGEKGSHVNAKTYTETLTPSLKSSSKALKVTFTGFTNAVNNGTVIETKTGEGEIAAVTMYAMSGSNKVKVYQTGDTYTSSSAVTAGTIYAATNLKNYYKSDKVTPNTHTPSCPAIDKTASDTTEYTVTGAFKYFIGDITAVNPETGRMDAAYAATYWDTDRSDLIQKFATTGWANTTTITSEHEYKKGTTLQTVAVPANYTTVTAQDANKGNVTFSLVKTIDFTNAQGYVSSYNIFVAPSYDGLEAGSKITFTSIK